MDARKQREEEAAALFAKLTPQQQVEIILQTIDLLWQEGSCSADRQKDD